MKRKCHRSQTGCEAEPPLLAFCNTATSTFMVVTHNSFLPLLCGTLVMVRSHQLLLICMFPWLAHDMCGMLVFVYR
jgi:hypothetical protein